MGSYYFSNLTFLKQFNWFEIDPNFYLNKRERGGKLIKWSGRRFHFWFRKHFWLIWIWVVMQVSKLVVSGRDLGECCCPEHLMLLVLALSQSPLVGHGWSSPLRLHGPLLWTDVTCSCFCRSISSQFYGLQEHFSTFKSISLLCFQRALKGTPMLAKKEVGLQWSRVALQCLWVQASLLICCWDFWFILWL